MTAPWNPLGRPAQYAIARQQELARRIGALIGSTGSTVLVPGEAITALEAVATALGVRGTRALNVVTSPYGDLFGRWLARGGAEVDDVTAAPGRPIEVDAVADALGRRDVDVVALVHGEAASGIVNPLDEISELARQSGALVVVDAVASVGAHRLQVDEQGLDVVVVGPQKALGGPASLSSVTLSDAARPRLHRGPLQSSITLPEPGEAVPLGTTDPLSFWALEAALAAVEDEGLDALIARHTTAAAATREGLRGLGTGPWIAEDDRASHLVTAAPVPDGIDPHALLVAITRLDPGAASRGVGPAADRFVRLNHTADRARFPGVVAGLTAYGTALLGLGADVDLGEGVRRAASVYRD